MGNKKTNEPGYLLDKTTGKYYPLREGRNLVGRKPKNSEPWADIPIESSDMGMSREHLYVDVIWCQDQRFHVYVSIAKAINPTYLKGKLLMGGDIIGLEENDIVTLCDTPLQFVGAQVDDTPGE